MDIDKCYAIMRYAVLMRSMWAILGAILESISFRHVNNCRYNGDKSRTTTREQSNNIKRNAERRAIKTTRRAPPPQASSSLPGPNTLTTWLQATPSQKNQLDNSSA